VVFAQGQADDPSAPGVHVQSIGIDQSPYIRRFEPGNPDADKDGYVAFPNIDLSIEYVNALEASRAYEANVTMMDTVKSMFNSSLRLLA
jgi:flagellar basal-body rod protein FlgC